MAGSPRSAAGILRDVAIYHGMSKPEPNHPATGKAGLTSWLAIKRQWSGLPEPGRWATQSQ